jgi:uncharacterized protein (TIRG00374 family)
LNKRTRTIINSIVFLIIGVLLFGWAVGTSSLPEILEDIKKAKLEYIIISVLCGIISHLARALRWNLLLEPMGYSARLGGLFHAVILGYLVNMAAPRVGEVTRPAALSRLENIPFDKLVGTVLIERVIDLLFTLIIGLSIVFLQFDFISESLRQIIGEESKNRLWLFAGLALLGLIALITFYKLRFRIYKLPLIQRIKGFIEGMFEGLKSVFKLKRKILFIFYSVLIWFMYFCMPYFVLGAFEGTTHLGVDAGLTVLLFGTIAMIIPIPGGWGSFHAVVIFALGLYAIPEELAKSYATLTHGIQILVILSIGLVSVFYFVYHSQKRKKNELDRTDK